MFCRYTRLSPIVGFIVAGMILGPHGFEVIEANKTTELLAKLGVVFLLFDIGLHFSTKSIWSARRDFLGLAPLQVLLCGIAMASALAFIFHVGTELALLAGFALALSSTAVVMQILGDLKESEAPVGKSAKAVLIFQDIAAIFLLIFADALGGDIGLAELILGALGKTILAVLAVMAFGQLVITPLMKSIIKFDDPEMFTVLGLLVVMLTAVGTEFFGLSLTLGAFLAGMVLAETPYRMMLQNELRPFRSLLLAFFFITVGMVLSPVMLADNLGTILSLTVLIVATKAIVFGGLLFTFRQAPYRTIQLSSLMAQGSEFALVIFGISAVAAGLGGLLTAQLVAAVTLSMLLTPILSALARRWSLNVCDKAGGTILNCPQGAGNPANNSPVFIIGMNEVGKTLARAFKAHNIPYVAVDFDRNRFLEATAAGYVVAYGQPSDLRFWNTLGVSNARAMCMAAPRYQVAKDISPIVKKLYPDLKRYVAVDDSSEGVRFATLGLIPFHNRGAPPGLEMACFILRELEQNEDKINQWIDEEQTSYLNTISVPEAVRESEGAKESSAAA